MNLKYVVISCAVCLLAGAGAGRYSLPAKVVTKTVVVDNTRTDAKVNDHSTTVTTKKPDGTTITIVHSDIDTTEHQTEQKKSESDKTTTYNTERWTINVVVATHLSSPAPVYGGQVEYRILGPFRIGALVLQDGTVSASIGLSF